MNWGEIGKGLTSIGALLLEVAAFTNLTGNLLISQLSFECGYSIASLSERLYCSEADDGKNMAGIFIYTASGDSEGTLGGLVRQGRPDALPQIFKKL